MDRKRLLSLTACWTLAIVLGLCVLSFANNKSETNPEAEQHFQKANELHILADYDAAIAEYRTVISLSPISKIAQNAQYWIGQLYFESKRFDAALSAFQKLHDEYPESRTIPTTTLMIERVQQAKKNRALFEAVKKADVEQVKLLIAKGADVDAKWVDVYNKNEEDTWWDAGTETTALRHAVKAGKIEVVKLLVEAGADVNAGEWTPLFQAVDENNTAIAEYLIDNGANVNINYPQGWRPLNQTVHTSNSVEMAELLIARGAEINAGYWPLLHCSTRRKRGDLIELLFQRGADVNAKDIAGLTPLYYAVHFHDDTEFVNILIANGAEVNIKHSGGRKPLEYAHSEGETLLQYAAIRGKTEAVKSLLEAGAKVDEKDDESGCTALHHAARFGKKNVAELLIARGADINAKDKQGHTPLYFAVNHGYQVAELLINKGADSSIRTESGRTLLQLAQQRKQMESTVPDMVFDGNPDSAFGNRIACGDVDGDGHDDILIGAVGENNSRGRVYLFYGGPDMDTTADLILEGQNKGDWFGRGIVCGDIDNDGHEDIIVATDGHLDDKGGRVRLYWGSDRNSMDADPDKIFVGEERKGSRIGVNSPVIYDIDNDGYDDIILGSFSNHDDGLGRVYLYYGNTKELMDTSHDLIFTAEKELDQYSFGLRIACGNIDNDDYGDIVIGSYMIPSSKQKVRAHLYYGDSRSNMNAEADVVFEVKSEGAQLGGRGIVCVDQNRDGYDDIIIGAHGYNKKQGRAFLFHGNSKQGLDTDPDMILDGEVRGCSYGHNAVCGDIDGDNVSDLIIGARDFRQGVGRVYVYSGKELAGPDPKPGRIFTGEDSKDFFGFGLACGDINNDGFDDLVIGAYGYKAACLSILRRT